MWRSAVAGSALTARICTIRSSIVFFSTDAKSTMATTTTRKRKADINPYDQALPFTFDLPESHLVFVDCPSQFREVVNFLGSAKLLGIDTETRPNFIGGQPKNRTALMQMAVRNTSGDERVYIFDLIKLLPRYSNELNSVLQPCMADRGVIKLGQELCTDMTDLGNSYPHMPCFRNVQSILEVNALAKILQPQTKHAIGLKKLTQSYLNYNLVKSQQMSNWAKRPLKSSQIHYAACDALVLIRLYDAMSMEVADLFGEYDFSSCYKHYQRQTHEEEQEARRKQRQRRRRSQKQLSEKAALEGMTTASETSESVPSEPDFTMERHPKAL